MGAWVSMEPRQRSVSARLTEVGVDMDLVSENLEHPGLFDNPLD